jgi:hypothetical protein
VDTEELWRELRDCFRDMSSQFSAAFGDTGWTKDDIRDFVRETVRSAFAGSEMTRGRSRTRRSEGDAADLGAWQDI